MKNVKKSLLSVQEISAEEIKGDMYADIEEKVLEDCPTLFLHSCCGPCSTAVIERLMNDYNITVFFYNPNITDSEEYAKRKEAQLKVIDGFNNMMKCRNKIDFMEGRYEPDKFFKLVSGLESEPEGAKRCSLCFSLRLEETAQRASLNNFDMFTTTLTVSPHKNYDVISSIGKQMAVKYAVGYLDGNFKKQDGFKRSIELSKQFEIYRQNYCGCEFSMWEK